MRLKIRLSTAAPGGISILEGTIAASDPGSTKCQKLPLVSLLVTPATTRNAQALIIVTRAVMLRSGATKEQKSVICKAFKGF